MESEQKSKQQLKRELAKEKLISSEPFEKEEEGYGYHEMDSERAKECARVVEGCLKLGAFDIAKKFIKHIEEKE